MSEFVDRIRALWPVLGMLFRGQPEHAVYSQGYVGDPGAWCYWDQEYPDEGSVGPFSTRSEAVAHSIASGAFES